MRFQELDWQDTPMGDIVLRRRLDPTVGVDVYEVKLGEEYLMSSLFTVAEIELAKLVLTRVESDNIDVLVGGLGLGYTAAAALADSRVRSATVVEALPAVISWHERELLPDTAGLAADPRSALVAGDFFAMASADSGFADLPGYPFDAVMLDIDHTPSHVLHPSHNSFYSVAGLTSLKACLTPAGGFGLWSDDPPDAAFAALLSDVFAQSSAEVVDFPNPLTGGRSANTVYLAAG